MKTAIVLSIATIVGITFVITACSSGGEKKVRQTAMTTEKPSETTLVSIGNFGSKIDPQGAIGLADLPALFTTSDTVKVTVAAVISSSCKHSGCWMDLDMGNGQTVHVTFEDESFTIPLDAAGKNAIAEGIAIRELIPVETLRNYAADDGKTKEEIALITEPVFTYEFVATGVYIDENRP